MSFPSRFSTSKTSTFTPKLPINIHQLHLSLVPQKKTSTRKWWFNHHKWCFNGDFKWLMIVIKSQKNKPTGWPLRCSWATAGSDWREAQVQSSGHLKSPWMPQDWDYTSRGLVIGDSRLKRQTKPWVFFVKWCFSCGWMHFEGSIEGIIGG